MPNLIAYDSETYLTEPGLLCPPGVCGSFADASETWVELFEPGLDTLEGALKPGTTLASAGRSSTFRSGMRWMMWHTGS